MLVGAGTRLVPTVYERLRAQRRRRALTIALCIALPTLLASVYYGFIASNRYVSDAKMVLSEGGSGAGVASSSKSSLLAMIGMGGGGGGETNEMAIVTQYLQSTEAMDALDKVVGLRRMWSASSIDFLSRLPKDASEERFHRYFKNHVNVIYDATAPVIGLKVEAFHRRDAQLIAKTLVGLAQKKLNTAYLKMREDSLRFARTELSQSERQLANVNAKLQEFRNAHGDIDPMASAQAVGSVAGGLFAQLAATEADLRTTLSYARADSSAVKVLKARIAALKQQIAVDRALLASRSSKKPYADLMASYEGLKLDQKFAEDAYTGAMAFLASSRAALARQHSYLIDFLPPTLPQKATEPRSVRDVALVFVASALICLTGSFIAAALREHARH